MTFDRPFISCATMLRFADYPRHWLARALLTVVLAMNLSAPAQAQSQVDEDQLGAWYMYFFNNKFENSQWGFQGDVQYRAWDWGSDLEQLLLRGGLTWRPQSNDIMFTLGYANITSGEFGDSSATSGEDRIYQEALIPQQIGTRYLLTHRFRFEQRWVDDQDFRTRFRYALFLNVPFNRTDLKKGAWYLSLYNELFINGQRDIGDDREVELFDRNRFYAGIGHSLTDSSRLQFGYMQQYTEDVNKGQLQFSLHQAF